MNKWVIYTALFGDYDHLTDPQVSLQEFDMICFTDQPNLKSARWKIIQIENQSIPAAKLNRQYKLLPHKFLSQYEVSVYVDVNIRILKNPKPLILEDLASNDSLLSKHLLRHCIYQEARECVIFKKASSAKTIAQISRYKKEGMPKNFGLYENNILIRKHNSPRLIQLMEHWWEEYSQGSLRDQLSWPYVLWKNKVSFPIGRHGSNDGVFFKIFPHKKEEISGFEKITLSITIRLRRIWYTIFQVA